MNNYVRSNKATETLILFKIKISIEFLTWRVKIHTHAVSQLAENHSLSFWHIIQNWHLTVVQLHLHFHYREPSFTWCMSLVAGSPYLCQKPQLLLCHLSHFSSSTNKQPATTKTHNSSLSHSNLFSRQKYQQ